MKVEALVKVVYTVVPSDEAYGTTDHAEIVQKEREWLDGEDGQGDYLIAVLESADLVKVVKTEEVV